MRKQSTTCGLSRGLNLSWNNPLNLAAREEKYQRTEEQAKLHCECAVAKSRL